MSWMILLRSDNWSSIWLSFCLFRKVRKSNSEEVIIRSEPDVRLARKLSVVAWIVTALVLILVGMMRRVKLDIGLDVSMLPAVNAILNSGTAIALLTAYYFIRRKEIARHRLMIFVAMGLSAVFFVCY